MAQPGIDGLVTDRTRAGRGRHLTHVVLVLAAPALVLSGLALQRGVSESPRAEDIPAPPRQQPMSSAPVVDPPPPPKRPGTPRRVIIPRLDVRAQVDPIETVDRTLVPPADPQRLGWWRDGARPGDPGTAVITGHTVHTGGGALDDLETLVPGDEVIVADGRTQVAYDVTSVEIYSAAEVARDHRRLFKQEGRPRLMLVTCEDWNGEIYLSSVIVMAEPHDAG